MTTLHLSLKGEYFDAIRDGTKPKEYRLANDYWTKRLVGREYGQIVLTKGYPARDDHARRITREWNGYTIETIQHPHFGAEPVTVFAIDVTRQIAHSLPGSPASKVTRPDEQDAPGSSIGLGAEGEQ